MAVTTPPRTRRGPRAATRRAYRHPAALPAQPTDVEILAAIKHAREQLGSVHDWDARLETSCIAVLGYLWRRGRAEKWAGSDGSAAFACSIAQLALGLADIMKWTDVPPRADSVGLGRFVRRHRRSVQRWLGWLEVASLVTHTPQQDADGFWWRTIITLRACPELRAELLQEAFDRRDGWTAREARRRARGRKRDLTAILRRARLTNAQKRARAIARRRQLAHHNERLRVRALVARSLADAAQTHLAHPCGASPSAQTPTTEKSDPHSQDRGHARPVQPQSGVPRTPQATTNTSSESPRPERARQPALLHEPRSSADREPRAGSPRHTTDANSQEGNLRVAAAARDTSRPASTEQARDDTYREIATRRWFRDTHPRDRTGQLAAMDRADRDWAPLVLLQQRRLDELANWPLEQPPPERWRIIEAWTVAAHGPQMACAGAFRLAFWSEHRPNHGPRLDRALARYQRHAPARPPYWPESPIAGLARWITETVKHQSCAEHGMARDVADFDRFTKQMAAYHAWQRPGHLERASARAARRRDIQAIADQVIDRLRFRLPDAGPDARLKTAQQLLASPHPAHQRAGATLAAKAEREVQHQTRDQRLLARQHPGLADDRYITACKHAERWNLPTPPSTFRR